MVALIRIDRGLFVLAVATLFFFSHASHANLAWITLDDTVANAPLSDAMLVNEHLSDIDSTLNLPNEASAWMPNKGNALQLTSSENSIWAQAHLHNVSPHATTWVIDIGSALADHIDVYMARDKGKPALIAQLGDRLPFSYRALDAAIPNAVLHLAPNERVSLFLNSRSKDGFHEVLMPVIRSPSDFVKSSQGAALIMGCIYGGLLVSMAYSMAAYIRIKHPLFIWFGLYSFTHFLYNFIKKGYAYQYFFSPWPELLNRSLPAVSIVGYVTFGLFLSAALDVKNNVPAWLNRLYLFSIFLHVIPAVLGLLNQYQWAWLTLIPIGSLFVFLAFNVALRVACQGSRPARFYLLAFSGLTVCILVSYLHHLRLVESNYVTENIVLIGTCIQYILLSIGVADQIAVANELRFEAERRAKQLQQATTQELDMRVKQRTVELEQANARLKTLSITDEMTHTFNRRYFNQQLDTALNMHARNGHALALCLLDVDHFKLFNDLYGHAAGDEVLRVVAGCIQAHLHRRGDMVFRVGGEEFAILITTEPDSNKVHAFVARIAKAIHLLSITHAGSPHGVVTASFGVAWLAASSEPMPAQKIYAKADAAMYQSKATGRNQVTLDATA